jgi:hypothetical protein
MGAIDQTKSLCLDVARATVNAATPSGTPPISASIGGELAEMLANQLAERLASVMPQAVVRTIGDDLLEGAEAIAEFVYGSDKERRKVYHLAQAGRIPVFRMGNTICARKSVVMDWIRQQENEGRTASEH